MKASIGPRTHAPLMGGVAGRVMGRKAQCLRSAAVYFSSPLADKNTASRPATATRRRVLMVGQFYRGRSDHRNHVRNVPLPDDARLAFVSEDTYRRSIKGKKSAGIRRETDPARRENPQNMTVSK